MFQCEFLRHTFPLKSHVAEEEAATALKSQMPNIASCLCDHLLVTKITQKWKMQCVISDALCH